MSDRSPVGSSSLPSTPGQRATSVALDLLVLGAGLGLAFFVGVSVASIDVALWVVLAWVLVVGPLYFALYHAFGGPEGGPGATPGQHESSLYLRDVETGGRLGLGWALVRSYAGLLSAALVVPAVIEALGIDGRRDGRSWRDRLTGSTVVSVPRPENAHTALKPTTAGERDRFAPSVISQSSLASQAGSLVRRRGREIVRPVLFLYLGLVVLVLALVPMLIADLGGDATDGGAGAAYWAILAVVIFVSGIYWTQAVIVVAVDAIRTGESLTPAAVLRRAFRRANALSVAIVLMAIVLNGFGLGFLALPIGLILGARCALVVPAIVLEDSPVLAAFRRSWRLTRPKAGRAIVLLLVSGLVLVATVWVTIGISFAIVAAAVSDADVVVFSLAAALALLLASVPLSAVIARVGAAWCLFYYSLAGPPTTEAVER